MNRRKIGKQHSVIDMNLNRIKGLFEGHKTFKLDLVETNIIEPKNENSGYLGCSEIGKSGLFKYTIRGEEIALEHISRNIDPISILYLRMRDSLLVHDALKQRVILMSSSNRFSEITSTNIQNVNDLIPYMKTLKSSPNGQDFAVMSSKSNLKIFKNFDPNKRPNSFIEYFESDSKNSSIVEFKFLNNQKLAVLWDNGTITFLSYSKPQIETLKKFNIFNLGLGSRNHSSPSTFAICPKEKNLIVSIHKNSSRSKEKLLLFNLDSDHNPSIKTMKEFRSFDYDSIINSIEIQYHFGDNPVVVTKELQPDSSLEVYLLKGNSFTQGFTLKKFFFNCSYQLKYVQESGYFSIDSDGFIKHIQIRCERSKSRSRTPNYVKKIGKSGVLNFHLNPRFHQNSSSKFDKISVLNPKRAIDYRQRNDLTPKKYKKSPLNLKTYVDNSLKKYQFNQKIVMPQKNYVVKKMNRVQSSLNFGNKENKFTPTKVRKIELHHQRPLQATKNTKSQSYLMAYRDKSRGRKSMKKSIQSSNFKKRKTEKSKVMITYENTTFKIEKESYVDRTHTISTDNSLIEKFSNFQKNPKKNKPINFAQSEIVQSYQPIALNLKVIDRVKKQENYSETSLDSSRDFTLNSIKNEELPPHEKSPTRGFIFPTPRYGTKTKSFLKKMENQKKTETTLEESRISEESGYFYHEPQADFEPWSCARKDNTTILENENSIFMQPQIAPLSPSPLKSYDETEFNETKKTQKFEENSILNDFNLINNNSHINQVSELSDINPISDDEEEVCYDDDSVVQHTFGRNESGLTGNADYMTVKKEKSVNEVMGSRHSTVDQSEKINEDFSNLKLAIKNRTQIKTPFEICVNFALSSGLSGIVNCEATGTALSTFKFGEGFSNFTYNTLKTENNFYDGVTINSKRIILSDVEHQFCYEFNYKDQSMKKVARISSTEIPNKSLRISQNKRFLLINDENKIRVYVIGKKEMFKTEISMACKKHPKSEIEEIEDFKSFDQNKCIIATTSSCISITEFDLKRNDWRQITQLDLNSSEFNNSKGKEKLQITAIAVSKNNEILSVSLVSDVGEDSKQRKLLIFKIREDFSLKLIIDYEFGNDQPLNTMFSHLNMNFTANGYQLLLAFEGGNTLGLHIYVISGDKLLLFEKIDYYHKTDFCALREFKEKIYSIDFDGVMSILDLSFLADNELD